MKTKIELEQDIISITAIIHKEFPELSKYIIEIPINDFEESEINIKNLEDYYHSLEEIVSKYAKNTHKYKKESSLNEKGFKGGIDSHNNLK